MLAAFDPEKIIEWIMGHLGPIFVAIFFFVLPILRGIREQAQKKRELEARGGATPAAPPTDEAGGRKAWEELLRGEAPTPPPAQATPPPIVRPAETAPPALSGPLSDFAPAPSENEEEAALDEERLATERNESLLREEMRRRSDFLARERESAARKTVAPEGITTIAADEAPRATGTFRTGRALLAWKGADRRTLLARAIVAREVLGPPLALRTDADALGPTALSR